MCLYIFIEMQRLKSWGPSSLPGELVAGEEASMEAQHRTASSWLGAQPPVVNAAEGALLHSVILS